MTTNPVAAMSPRTAAYHDAVKAYAALSEAREGLHYAEVARNAIAVDIARTDPDDVYLGTRAQFNRLDAAVTEAQAEVETAREAARLAQAAYEAAPR